MRVHLCFHGLGTCESEREPGEARYWVGETVFLGILDGLAGRGDVELSFDDGNLSDVEVALPALQDRGLTASFFVLAGRLGDPASLGPDDLRTLRDAGATIGTHGWDHVPWRGLGGTDLRRELVEARTAIETASGTPVRTAAVPWGRYDRRVLSALGASDYTTVFTSDRFPSRSSSWLRARYSVRAEDSVDSVMNLVQRAPGPREARNVLASLVKRHR